jgi:hypothetical protein
MTFIFSVSITNSLGQSENAATKPCNSGQSRSLKYDVLSVGQGLGSPVVGVRVFVKEKNINKYDLTLITQLLKAKYCNASRLGVTFFDDRRAGKIADIIVKHLTGERTALEIRGFYNYDKERGVNSFSFNPKRGESFEKVDLEKIESNGKR